MVQIEKTLKQTGNNIDVKDRTNSFPDFAGVRLYIISKIKLRNVDETG